MIAFTGNPLDRASDRRADAEWLTAARRDARSKILPLWKLQPLLLGPEGGQALSLGFLDSALGGGLGDGDAIEVFLGLDGEVAYFARDITALADPLAAALAGLGHFRDARSATALLTGPETAILGQAKALIDWHNRNGHCANCGAATAIADGGWRRLCPRCQAEHFPRTDPTVIMLVTRGETCLFARNRRFTNGFYSTLAGFVEPGETIEEAVAREVREEVGLKVEDVRYFASQPWPFPSSLMIGCFAHSPDGDIKVDGAEILEAQWLDRARVRTLLTGAAQDIALPRRDAIARLLIATWAEGEGS